MVAAAGAKSSLAMETALPDTQSPPPGGSGYTSHPVRVPWSWCHPSATPLCPQVQSPYSRNRW